MIFSRFTGAGSTWSPLNKMNTGKTTPSAFLHQQLDVTAHYRELF
jgi:hypothetical protein